MICLDTNAVIAALNERPKQVATRLDAEIARGTQILLPTVVLYELRYGVARSGQRARNASVLEQFLTALFEVVAFDAEDAGEAGSIRAALEKAGTPIGPYDLLIAAQARRRGAALITANDREFARVPGLIVMNWALE